MRGHIRKRGNKYAIVVDLGVINGKRIQKWFSGYEKERDAELDLPNILMKINNNTFTDPKKITLNEYIDKWYESKKKRLRDSTIHGYDTIVKRIKNGIGHLKLRDIKPAHLQAYYDSLDGEVSPKTIKNTYSVLNLIIKKAMVDGIITINYNNLTERPTVKKPKKHTWNATQMKIFLDFIMDKDYYITYLIEMCTGMRTGELLGLKYNDIDYKENTISINKARQVFGMEELKTDSSYRTIVVPQKVIDEIKKDKLKHENEYKIIYKDKYEKNDFICKYPSGKLYHPSYPNKLLHKIANELKLPKIRFYDLRHSHHTLLSESNVKGEKIMRRAGHTDYKTTVNNYINPESDDKKIIEEVMKKII